MSARTSLAVIDANGSFPENAPATKTTENMDVAAGNKILNIDENTVIWVEETSGNARTVTYTYDDDAGVERTKAVALGANERTLLGPFKPRMTRHAGDAAEAGALWLTANGTAGQVKARAIRFPPGTFK